MRLGRELRLGLVQLDHLPVQVQEVPVPLHNRIADMVGNHPDLVSLHEYDMYDEPSSQ